MGGRIRTRIAIIVLVLLATSAAAVCYVIAQNAQAAADAAIRSRIAVLTRFLGANVQQDILLGIPLQGPSSLQTLLDSAMAREPNLEMLALLDHDGEIMASTGHGEPVALIRRILALAGPTSAQPEILQVGSNLVSRITITSAFDAPLGQLIVAMAPARAAPDIERVLIVLLRGSLVLVIVMVPVVLAGVWLALRPASRGIGQIAAVLEAMGQGREPLPPPLRSLAGRGDPYWDAADAAEEAADGLTLVDRFAEARAALARAEESLRQVDREVSRLDTVGAAALSDQAAAQDGAIR